MSGVLFELTDACELQCRFCYRSESRVQPMTPFQRRQVLGDVLRHPGVDSLTFIGGEPLQDGDFFPLCAAIHEALPGLRMGVCTNGRHLDAQRLAMMIRLGVSHLELPLFTLDPKRYCHLTGANGLADVRDGLRAAVQAGFGVTVGVVLLKETCAALRDIVYTATLLGAELVSLFTFVPAGRSGQSAAEFTPTPSELEAAFACADTMAATLGCAIQVATPGAFRPRYAELFPNLMWGTCGRGLRKWVVSAEGQLLSCELGRRPLGSLLQQPMAQLVASPQSLAVRKESCETCRPHLPEAG